MKTISLLGLAATVMLAAACGPKGQEQTAPDNQNTSDMDNPVIEAIMGRRSVRQYKDTPVEREKLMKIAECGINAPNAMNRQDWELRIIDDEDFLNGATEVMKQEMPGMVNPDEPGFRNAFRNAKVLFAIACPDEPSDVYLQNVGLMSENICLAAWSMGLGTCIMASPARFLNSPAGKPFLDRLGFSEGYKLQITIACGYPDESPEARPRDAGKIKFVEK